MSDCIFCKIASGQIPCYKVWEDGNFLAFLDIHPETVGYTLVIPKKHFRWVWEVENYAEYFEKVREVALLLKEKLTAEWVLMNVVGVDVPHAHVHLIPHQSKINFNKEQFKEISNLLQKKHHG